jgi:hypothetical protein
MKVNRLAVAQGEGHRLGVTLASELLPLIDAAGEDEVLRLIQDADQRIEQAGRRYGGPALDRRRAFIRQARRTFAIIVLSLNEADEPPRGGPPTPGPGSNVVPFRARAA